MATTSRTTDEKARITLPGNFANCTVLIEEVNDTELRVRKARVIPLDELPFIEEAATRLSDRDRDIFLALLDNPPPPNEALRELMSPGIRDAGSSGASMERKIIVYGHPDKEPGFGFPAPADFREWIRDGIFSRYQGRYHYTSLKDADVIILSREGLAYGHFEIEGKDASHQKDREEYPNGRVVYIVRSSALYGKPVRLKSLDIKGINFGRIITETQFDEIKRLAGDIQEYQQTRSGQPRP